MCKFWLLDYLSDREDELLRNVPLMLQFQSEILSKGWYTMWSSIILASMTVVGWNS